MSGFSRDFLLFESKQAVTGMLHVQCKAGLVAYSEGTKAWVNVAKTFFKNQKYNIHTNYKWKKAFLITVFTRESK